MWTANSMCWSLEVSIGMVALGVLAAAISPPGFIRWECAFVTAMEVLQLVSSPRRLCCPGRSPSRTSGLSRVGVLADLHSSRC